MRIEVTKRFLAQARRLAAADAAQVDQTLAGLLAVYGWPHIHQGGSIRPLRPAVYEPRATRALRIVFVRCGDVLKVDFLGDH